MYSKKCGIPREVRYLAAAEGLDAGPDEGGALGADSDEEEKRANRAKAAGNDQTSRAEGRNQGNNADVRGLHSTVLLQTSLASHQGNALKIPCTAHALSFCAGVTYKSHAKPCHFMLVQWQ